MNLFNTKNDVYLSSNLKYLRTLAGRSQAEMAEALDLNRSTYSGYEVGSAEPNASVLCRMALRHRVTLDMLLMLDLRKWTRFALETEQRKRAGLAPVATEQRVEPKADEPVKNEAMKPKLIHERMPRAMNQRLKSQAKNEPKPAKPVQPAVKDTVLLRLDAKTTVRVKPGYALEQWQLRYPQAVVVEGGR